MKKRYWMAYAMKVAIIGGNVSGLRCAELLASKGVNVEVFELHKKGFFKACAAGYTPKGMQEFPLAEEMIERQFDQVLLHTRSGDLYYDYTVYMISRSTLHEYQWDLAEDAGATIHERCRVSSVDPKRDVIELSDGSKAGYDLLVGADGSNSIVRRTLNLPFKKVSLVQFTLPYLATEEIEVWVDWKHKVGYYSFPHDNYTLFGCGAKEIPYRKIKELLRIKCESRGVDLSKAETKASPINISYRGMNFGNIYLIGDAGGFASGLTGEGISQSLFSAKACTLHIMGEERKSRIEIDKLLMNKFYFMN